MLSNFSSARSTAAIERSDFGAIAFPIPLAPIFLCIPIPIRSCGSLLYERHVGGIERETWGQFEPVEDRFEYFQIGSFLEVQPRTVLNKVCSRSNNGSKFNADV